MANETNQKAMNEMDNTAMEVLGNIAHNCKVAETSGERYLATESAIIVARHISGEDNKKCLKLLIDYMHQVRH